VKKASSRRQFHAVAGVLSCLAIAGCPNDSDGGSCGSLCQHMGSVCDDFLNSAECELECGQASEAMRSCVEGAYDCGSIYGCLNDCGTICQHMGSVCDDFLGSATCVDECSVATDAQRACVQEAGNCGAIYTCLGG